MNSNNTPTSSRVRSTSSQNEPPQASQENPMLGFQTYSQFSQSSQTPYYPHFPTNFNNFPQFQHPIHPNAVRSNMLQSGWMPAPFPLPQPDFNTGLEDIEVIPETPETIYTEQPSPRRSPTPTTRSTQKGKARNYENRAPKRRWTKDEEVALASAWVDASEDPIIGNAQTGDKFWERVEAKFYTIMKSEPYRSVHQINSKFNELSRKVKKFIAIYSNLVNPRPSGASDADILKKAHARYIKEHKLPFTDEQVWDVLKQSPKWCVVESMTTTSRGTKRTTTEEDDEEVRELLQRPIGRNKAKKAAKSSGTDDVIVSEINTLKSHIQNSVEYKMKKLEVEAGKLEEKDYEFFIAPNDHLTGPALKANLARKAKIAKKYGWE